MKEFIFILHWSLASENCSVRLATVFLTSPRYKHGDTVGMKVSSDWESHGSSSDKKHVWDEKNGAPKLITILCDLYRQSSWVVMFSFHGHFGLSFWLVKSSTRSAHAKPFPAVQSYHRRLVRSGQCPFQHFKQQLLTDFKAVARVTNPLEQLRAGWLPFLFFSFWLLQ